VYPVRTATVCGWPQRNFRKIARTEVKKDHGATDFFRWRRPSHMHSKYAAPAGCADMGQESAGVIPMKHEKIISKTLLAAASMILAGSSINAANATEPCGDFGACKVLIEINSSDGDIGFHFLMDGDDLIRAAIYDPNHKKIFKDVARHALREQFLTETFAESAEPLCFDPTTDDDEENDDEDFVTLEEFIDRWTDGTYQFIGLGKGWEASYGATDLTYHLPAAPTDVVYDDETGIISWDAGDDLGACADVDELTDFVAGGLLPQHPRDVTVASWEIVFEPDVDDGDPAGSLKFSVRVSGDIEPRQVTVPADYIASLPDDTPIKIEVGAIGEGDNATFTEEDDICINENEGCGDEEE